MKKFIFGLLISLCCMFQVNTGYAQVLDTLDAGTYPIDASLSCYINAMGGVEFGGPMLRSAEVTVAADGTKTMTMHLQKSVVTIYSVTCDTFVDAAPDGAVTEGSVPAGTIGCYDENGTFTTAGVHYTLSDDTALNSKQEEVRYVTSITFPIQEEKESYRLSLYINSNVMGTQFSNDGNPAVLSVNWDSVSDAGNVTETTKAAEASMETTAAENTTQATAQTNTSKEAEVQDETTAANVEKMNGLNLYRAEEQNEQEESEQEEVMKPEETMFVTQSANENYTAYFDRTVLAIAATAGVMLILIGAVLIVIGVREDKKHGNE